MMRKEALKDKLSLMLDYFASDDSIITVYLFGSFGTNNYVPSLSDIDLAIVFGDHKSIKEEMKISADISILLEREDVDVVNLSQTRVDLSHEIISTGEIIYEKDKIKTADFVEQTLQQYFDYGIPLKKLREEFLESLKGGIVPNDGSA